MNDPPQPRPTHAQREFSSEAPVAESRPPQCNERSQRAIASRRWPVLTTTTQSAVFANVVAQGSCNSVGCHTQAATSSTPGPSRYWQGPMRHRLPP